MSPLVPGLTGYDVGPGNPAHIVIGILTLIESGLCACQGCVFGEGVGVGVGVVGILVFVEGSVRGNYLANLDACPLVVCNAFYDICPGEPTFAVIGIFALVVARCRSGVLVKGVYVTIRVVGVLVCVEPGVGLGYLSDQYACPLIQRLTLYYVCLGEPAF